MYVYKRSCSSPQNHSEILTPITELFSLMDRSSFTWGGREKQRIAHKRFQGPGRSGVHSCWPLSVGQGSVTWAHLTAKEAGKYGLALSGRKELRMGEHISVSTTMCYFTLLSTHGTQPVPKKYNPRSFLFAAFHSVIRTCRKFAHLVMAPYNPVIHNNQRLRCLPYAPSEFACNCHIPISGTTVPICPRAFSGTAGACSTLTWATQKCGDFNTPELILNYWGIIQSIPLFFYPWVG